MWASNGFGKRIGGSRRILFRIGSLKSFFAKPFFQKQTSLTSGGGSRVISPSGRCHEVTEGLTDRPEPPLRGLGRSPKNGALQVIWRCGDCSDLRGI